MIASSASPTQGVNSRTFQQPEFRLWETYQRGEDTFLISGIYWNSEDSEFYYNLTPAFEADADTIEESESLGLRYREGKLIR